MALTSEGISSSHTLPRRDYTVTYINGKRYHIQDSQSFLSLSDFLRYEKSLCGTKVVCAEGDCGACTVLVYRYAEDIFHGEGKLKAINSCVAFMHQLDACVVVTVEGLKNKNSLHPMQASMIKCFGAQCGYCTPGIVCSLAGLVEEHPEGRNHYDQQKVKNFLTGNLCRCTGYEPIIEAGMKVEIPQDFQLLKDRYVTEEVKKDLAQIFQQEVKQKNIFLPPTLKAAQEIKKNFPQVKVVAGSTDLGVLVNKHKYQWQQVMSLDHIAEMYQIQKKIKNEEEEEEEMSVGAKVNLREVEKFLEPYYPEFSRLIHIFASHQIKNSATLVGNVANGSPIGDSIPFLLVIEAQIELLGKNGFRQIPLAEFYLGYKKFNMTEDEFITRLILPLKKEKLKLYKTSLRKDLDISAVTSAFCYQVNEDNKITSFHYAVGGVAATVLTFPHETKDLIGKSWSEETFQHFAETIVKKIQPLSDVRGSQEFRLLLVKNLIIKFFQEEGEAV